MRKFYTSFKSLGLGLCLSFLAVAVQSNVYAQESDPGRLTGSFETNTIYYVPDMGEKPDAPFGSNNYFKMDYSRGKFAAGIQYELYAPVLQGFDPALTGGKIVNKYASWIDSNFSVTVGDFYEQFGNGLILRSYEDRALGFNNSLEGVRVSYMFSDFFNVRALWARPRLLMDYADSWVRGIDASFILSPLFNWDMIYLALEGSYVNRYDNELAQIPDWPTGPDTNAYSGRLNFEYGGFSAKAEMAFKDEEESFFGMGKGSAQQVELGYIGRGLGISAVYRKLEHMSFKLMDNSTALINSLNYLPALVRQHTYMLANLNPYIVSADKGEQGGQLDVFYNFGKGTALGGKYGMKVHLNGSMYYELPGDTLRYADISFDVERQWNKKFKTALMYTMQLNPSSTEFEDDVPAHIVVADLLYKFTAKMSARVELQYLHTTGNGLDWMAALAEVNFAHRWRVFVSDMYNHGNEEEDSRVHYYSAGFSYNYSRTRLALSFGRNRAGYICSGGVCRMMPEYTGLNLSLTTYF